MKAQTLKLKIKFNKKRKLKKTLKTKYKKNNHFYRKEFKKRLNKIQKINNNLNKTKFKTNQRKWMSNSQDKFIAM